jgi:ubiquinone/menaquinone biosynthesis C-methylase UbiE
MKSDNLMGNGQFYADLGERARAQYDSDYAACYRKSDDEGLGGPTHTDQGNLLTEVSASFGRPIDVLDLGCGTGRYWHHLRNLRRLTGVDVSPDMLRQAQHPVREFAITVPVKLLCKNLTEISFPDGSFDLVYAIGVLGRFMPLDGYIVSKVWRMLKPCGTFVVSTMDRQSVPPSSLKRRAIKTLLPFLPTRFEHMTRVRWQDFAMTEDQLQAMFAPPHWATATITRRGNRKTEWVCRANKD